jgi:DNA helicase-2/ATP-dependent DNA helicase PcrA
LQQFITHLELLEGQTRTLPLAQKMEKIIAASGLIEHFQKEKSEQGEARVENLQELVNAAKGFERPEEEGQDPVLNFLTHAALEAGEGQAAQGSDAVQLMTLHAAKGLEFPHVFMVGLENGLFPSMRAVDEGNLEEERRLAYVGITRARQQLFITYAESRRVYGKEQICAPSSFLAEIPKELTVEMRPRAGLLRSEFGVQSVSGGFARQGGSFGGPRSFANGGVGSGYDHSEAWRQKREEGYNLTRPAMTGRLAAEANANPQGYRVGERVSHPSFGEGVIQGFEGQGERMQVEIHFKSAGSKRLMLSLAKLLRL